MTCPGSFLFGQRHPISRNSNASTRDSSSDAPSQPTICPLNGLLPANASTANCLCETCQKIPAALVARELVLAVDLNALRSLGTDAEKDSLFDRMQKSEARWVDQLQRRRHAKAVQRDEILDTEKSKSAERLASAAAALMADSWTPELFSHLARRFADDESKEDELWVLSLPNGDQLGHPSKHLVLVVFLNAIRLRNWKRSFSSWQHSGSQAGALVDIQPDYIPLFPSSTFGISLHPFQPARTPPIPIPIPIPNPSPSSPFDPAILHDAASRLSLIFHNFLHLPAPPRPQLTLELCTALDRWLRSWYAAIVTGSFVPSTKAGAAVQGGALVDVDANGNTDHDEDEEEEGVARNGEELEKAGTNVGSVVTAVAIFLKRWGFFFGAVMPNVCKTDG